MSNRQAVHNPADVPHVVWSALDIPVFEQLLETRELPAVQPWMEAVDRRRLARLHETRRAVEAQLAMLKSAYKAAEQREPAVPAATAWWTLEDFVERPRIITPEAATAAPAKGLWLPASYAPAGATPAGESVPGYTFVQLTPAALVNWIASSFGAAEHDERRSLFNYGVRLLRRELRRIAGYIDIHSSTLNRPALDHPHSIVTKERPWFLLHGAHPPDILRFVARPIPKSLSRTVVEPQNRSGALAA